MDPDCLHFFPSFFNKSLLISWRDGQDYNSLSFQSLDLVCSSLITHKTVRQQVSSTVNSIRKQHIPSSPICFCLRMRLTSRLRIVGLNTTDLPVMLLAMWTADRQEADQTSPREAPKSIVVNEHFIPLSRTPILLQQPAMTRINNFKFQDVCIYCIGCT